MLGATKVDPLQRCLGKSGALQPRSGCSLRMGNCARKTVRFHLPVILLEPLYWRRESSRRNTRADWLSTPEFTR